MAAKADDDGAPFAAEEPTSGGRFEVRLENFNGPFDLLLSLISKHELDITEIALAKVTDEFIGYIRAATAAGDGFSLDEASEFLVIAATLLDLKAARLLPAGEVEDDEDIALLEARDLLFARLLQYKAFKEIARRMGDRLAEESARYPRSVALEPQFAAMMPELTWRMSASDFAAVAAKALEPREPAPTEVGIGHLHAPAVSVREQADIIGHRLQEHGVLSFRQLAADAESLLVVVVRFLALLEMFRDAVITMDQTAPLGELTVRWSAGEREWTAESISEEYDLDPSGSAAGNKGAGEGATDDRAG
ncbi:segregation/condensation protein A [Arthrobacter sp. JZ12]|uniref:segregation and condensation protein A n=1 Tax=Arthrobacter sp. JZ12 TaxID=2654190 RepID=UPI002B46202D|nr:ScpA family protein [Arthrobacter sp. JZ12]WRH24693.1 segregation/condensation protein A [Arthrobacter sp. JZ12]